MVGTSWHALFAAAPTRLQAWMSDRRGSTDNAVQRALSRFYGGVLTDSDAALAVSGLVDNRAGARKYARDLGSADSQAYAIMFNALLDAMSGDLVSRAFYAARAREAPVGWKGRDAYGEQIRDLDIGLLLQNELQARNKGKRGGRLIIDEAAFAERLGDFIDLGGAPPWLNAFRSVTGWTMRREKKPPEAPTTARPAGDPLTALRREAPVDLGAYGGLAWALSALVKQRTGVNVSRDYWTMTWHWPLAQFADKPNAPLQDVAVSLLEAERSRTETALRNADADLASVWSARRAGDDVQEFPIDRVNLVEWVNRKRGKAKWVDPALAMILHSFAEELKEQIHESLLVRAKTLETAAKTAQAELESYRKTTREMEKDAEYMSAFRRAVGIQDEDPFVVVVQRRQAKAIEHQTQVAEMHTLAERAQTRAYANQMFAHFLEHGHPRAYGKGAEVIDKLRAILRAPPPAKSSKPVAYVYERYNGELQVWPVLSVDDARALFVQRQAQPGNRDINGVALQGQKLADAVEVTKQELIARGKEVLTVKVHPVWP